MNEWEAPPDTRRPVGRIALAAAAALLIAGLALLRSPDAPAELEISRELVPPVEEVSPTWPPPRAGEWRVLPPAPLTSRVNFAVAWTGTEMIVWGGFDALNRPQLDGAAFDVDSGTWRTLPLTVARDAAATAVTTRSQVVFVSQSETRRYDPAENRWRSGPAVPVPDGHTVGDQVLAAGWAVVAVTEPHDRTRPSGLFTLRPGADQWERLPDIPVTMTQAHTVVASGDQVTVIGPPSGEDPAAVAIDLERVPPAWRRTNNPPRLGDATDSWRPVAAPPGIGEQPLEALSATAYGDDIMLYGVRPQRRGGYVALRRDGQWRRFDAGPLRPSRYVAVLWTGSQMLVWDRLDNRGALLDPETGRWTHVPRPPVVGRDLAREAVWGGDGLLVWGALGSGGAMFTPP